MTYLPTHMENWASYPRDLDANDFSRFRGELPPDDAVEVHLGKGLTQVTYVDCLLPRTTAETLA